jgi:hypothetical protein
MGAVRMGSDGNRKRRRGRVGEAVSDNDDGGSVAREAVMGEARSWGAARLGEQAMWRRISATTTATVQGEEEERRRRGRRVATTVD